MSQPELIADGRGKQADHRLRRVRAVTIQRTVAPHGL
jgi:hypothetical protein